MSEENKNQSHGRAWVVITLAIALPLLYVLSVGPAVAISNKCPKCGVVFQEFYFPLVWLDDHTVFREPLDAYIELWE